MDKAILLANAALALLEELIPAIDARIKRGEISVEDQMAIKSNSESLRDKLDVMFDQPHWKIE